MENLLVSWQEFLRGKRKRKDVTQFSLRFMDNILKLHEDLVNKTYKHGFYYAFKINDPKPRDIHKATVRDRIVHHAIYEILYPYFDKKFIFDSYSCRNDKGTHKALNRFRYLTGKISKNHTKSIWVLKGDIRKFFATIDHQVLKNILSKHIVDKDILWLLGQVIDSFNTEGKPGIGLPLGNVTSQLLINVYMNEFDQYLKRKLEVKFYIRYADDFVIFHQNKTYITNLIPEISQYLEQELKISLHQDKVFIKPFTLGIDFLGWIHFPYHRVLRTSTKRRMIQKLKHHFSVATITSYLGLLKHGNTYKIVKEICDKIA